MASYNIPQYQLDVFNSSLFPSKVSSEHMTSASIPANVALLYPNDLAIPSGYEAVSISSPEYIKYTGG